MGDAREKSKSCLRTGQFENKSISLFFTSQLRWYFSSSGSGERGAERSFLILPKKQQVYCIGYGRKSERNSPSYKTPGPEVGGINPV